jgi:Fic family protein
MASVFVHPAPQIHNLITELGNEAAFEAISKLGPESTSAWAHWDKLRHLEPPEGLNHKQWWLGVKFARRPLLRPLPLNNPDGDPFMYAMPDEVLRLLHHVDQHCSGEIAMPDVVISDEHSRQRYLVNSLMEEAIRSSQLEGATTSRRAALELLRSGRSPKDRSERMIMNNYRALEFIRDSADKPLTPALVLQLHRIVTEGTLDDPSAAGRLQTPDEDRVAVYDVTDGSLVHKPPPAEQLPERLDALCAFANGQDTTQGFVHPVVRAILVHFWLAYDHPFEDGNGRTARALFYWSMRKSGYWLTEYLSISRILRQAPAQYSEAFLLTETDGGDTTYFVIYQLGVIERAVTELHAYLRRKAREIREAEQVAKGSADLNHRQLALIGDALRTPGRRYTYASHANSHGVTHETSRTDLATLEQLGLLTKSRVGRRHVYAPSPELPERLRTGAGA